jgi:hypothetical protein
MTVGKNREFRFEKAVPLKATSATDLAGYAGGYMNE